MEDTTEEHNAYDVWNENIEGDGVEISEGWVPISIREIIDVQQTNGFCEKILSAMGRGTSESVKTDDAVLRRIPPEIGAD